MRARLSRVGGIVAAAVLATGVLAAPAHAETTTITGTITAADTGSPVAACVAVYDTSYDAAAYTCTDDGGHYTADGLTAGASYKVWVDAQDSTYRSGWADGADAFETTTAYTAPATVDASLQLARAVGDGTISGTLTAADTGAPIQGCLDLWTDTGDYLETSCEVGEDGSWQFTRLSEDVGYTIHATTWDGEHVGEWYDGKAGQQDATVLHAPATVAIALDLGAHLRGTLLRPDGAPASWVNVSPEPVDGSSAPDGAYTDEDGHWDALVPAGTYRVRFDAYPAVQWAFGKETAAEADAVTVSPGATATVDDRLLPGATVAGRITADGTRAPVEGACVDVVALRFDGDVSVAQACTDSDGRYSVDVPVKGTFAVKVTDPQGRFAGEYAGNTRKRDRATTYTLARGDTVTVDAGLAPGAQVTGTVVDSVTGRPVANVCPFAYLGNAGAADPWSTKECSNDRGVWTLRGLPAGSYAVRLDGGPGSPYAGTWAFKAATQASADLITVDTGQVKAVRPVKVSTGGTVSGVVTDPAGQPVEGAWVSIDDGWPGRAGPGEGRYTAQTDAQGRYTITGAPLGDHPVFVYSGYGSDLAPEWSGNSATKAGASTIRIRAGRTTDFDAQLAPGAHISGDVLTASGTPSTDYWLGFVYAADGTYIGDFDVYGGNTFTTTALPAGRFTLRLENADTGQTTWYDGAATRRDATRVRVTEGGQAQVTVHLP
ncbi:carboxypeptidase regulatory-like domain-containing protein [Pedococcus sp. NPDC057267]|uniref:carboxypeptidase regulatory-like domain-containing protein n=1 Tax=Pedococcus sp. NPDC057267 TaxID=3346077 RepID=UPI00362DE661